MSTAASWITGEIFGWLRERGLAFEQLPLPPHTLAELLDLLNTGEITPTTARAVLEAHPAELAAYRGGKSGLANWFFGQVMRRAGGLANPQVIRAELQRQLDAQSSDDIPEK